MLFGITRQGPDAMSGVRPLLAAAKSSGVNDDGSVLLFERAAKSVMDGGRRLRDQQGCDSAASLADPDHSSQVLIGRARA
jgi:hypothetical protein